MRIRKRIYEKERPRNEDDDYQIHEALNNNAVSPS